MAGNIEKVRMLLSITERGGGKKLTGFLYDRGIKTHLRATGHGTASSEMMDILGLGSSDKDVIFSFGTDAAVRSLAAELSGLEPPKWGNGIMMLMSPDAVGNIFAAVVSRQGAEKQSYEGNESMKSEYSHSLICISVNVGYTEEVMTVAKKAGATGGTVIRANLADAGSTDFHGVLMKNEKEILTILAPDSVRDQIMEDVNRQFGIRSEAEGIIFSLPVDKTFKR